jgi:hypothetical protein
MICWCWECRREGPRVHLLPHLDKCSPSVHFLGNCMQHFLYITCCWFELTRRGKAIKLLADCLNLPFMWWAALSLLQPNDHGFLHGQPRCPTLMWYSSCRLGKDQRDQGLQIGTGLETTWDTGQCNLHKQPEHPLPISLVLYKKYWAPCPFFVLESMPCASPRCTHLPESTLSGLLFSVKVSGPQKKTYGGTMGSTAKSAPCKMNPY